MLFCEHQSAKLSDIPNVCHPERSLGISEANRQTKSKDPMAAGTKCGDARCSHRNVWPSSILLTFFLVWSIVSFGQAAKFPGPNSKLTSPDGRWVLQNVNPDSKQPRTIFLKDKTTGKTRKICEYGRSVGLLWSPNSRRFALNDRAGSDYTETSILSVDETVRKIDVQDAILRDAKAQMPSCDHCYFGVSRWLDDRSVVVFGSGYGNGSPLFCLCYIYTLNGKVRKCLRQPKPDSDFCQSSRP
jgi:hypothetical protein